MKYDRAGTMHLILVWDQTTKYDIRTALRPDESICLATRVSVVFDHAASDGLAVTFGGDLAPRFFAEWCREKNYHVEEIDKRGNAIVIVPERDKGPFRNAVLGAFDVRKIEPVDEFLCVRRDAPEKQSWTRLPDFIGARRPAAHHNTATIA